MRTTQAATETEKEGLGRCRVCGVLTRPATDLCVEHAAAGAEVTDWRELANDLGKALRWTLGTGGGHRETSTETKEVLQRWQAATEAEKEAQS